MSTQPQLFHPSALEKYPELTARRGIVITGGAASGKSTASRWLADWLCAPVFSCDACVARLLAEDKPTQLEVANAFPEAFIDNQIRKEVLRERVFQDDEARKKLEQILHPRVWDELVAFSNQQDATQFVIVEIPLLFETGWRQRFNSVLLIASSREVQIERLVQNRGLERKIAEAILDSQWEMDWKVTGSTWVIWNNGSLESLNRQLRLLPFDWKR